MCKLVPQNMVSTNNKTFNHSYIIESIDLFKNKKTIHIRHNQEIYRLQITKNRRLILTK